MIDRCRSRPLLIASAIFILGLALRLAYNEVTLVDQPVRADAKVYLTTAYNLVTHGVFSPDAVDHPTPDYTESPGYPLFLALFLSRFEGDAYHPILVAQALLGALTVLFTLLAARHFLPPWAAAGSGLLTALSPHLITSGSYLLTETLFTFLLAAALYAFVAARARAPLLFALCGLALGAAALVRPVILPLPLLLMGLLLIRGDAARRRGAAALLLGAAVAWLPWLAWSTAHPAPAETAQSPDRLAHTFATGLYPDLVHRDPRLRGYPYRDDPAFDTLSRDMGSALQALAQRAGDDPLTYIRWYLIGKPTMFWSPDILVGQGGPYIYPVKRSLFDSTPATSAWLAAMQAAHPWIVVVSLIGLALFARRLFAPPADPADPAATLALAALAIALLYATAVHSVLLPLPRYSIPFRVALYPFFFASLIEIARALPRRPEQAAGEHTP